MTFSSVVSTDGAVIPKATKKKIVTPPKIPAIFFLVNSRLVNLRKIFGLIRPRINPMIDPNERRKNRVFILL